MTAQELLDKWNKVAEYALNIHWINVKEDLPSKYSFLDNMGRRYIKLDIDIMTCNGMRYFTTFRYTAPVTLDLSMGGGWAADLSGLSDRLFEQYPTLAHRKDIRICLNDAKVVKHIQH